MSESSEKPHLAPLPESLRKQLESFKKHLWRIKITEAVLAGLLGLVVSFAIVFALDRIWEIPPLVRLIILLAGVSLFAVFAPLWINRWIFKHRKENQLARLISKHYPNLGDRLLGVVELQDQKESQTALSPELREAAMIAVAHDAQNRDLDKALSSSWTRKLSLGLAAVALIAGGAFVAYPSAGKNAFARWFMPLSDTKRFTFTKADLSKIPQPLYVPIGESFTIDIPLRDDTEEQPEFASARYGNAQWKDYQYENGLYALEFPGKRKKANVELKLGDANHNFDVRPIHRPKISAFHQEVTYPEYLQRTPVTNELASTQTDILEGSKVVIIASADRALSSANTGKATFVPQMEEISAEEAEIQGIDINARPEPQALNLNHKISGDAIITNPILIRKGTVTLPLSWTDIHGISGLASAEFTIHSQPDTPPSTFTQGIAKQKFMLYNEVLEFEMSAEDNFGIKAAGVEWAGEFATPTAETPSTGDITLLQGDPYMTSGNKPVSIDFQRNNIKPQKLIIRTWVEDYNPDTARVYSEPIEVFVLSESEHASHVKEMMNDTLSKLEDAMRTEQDNLDENKRIEKELKDPKKAAEAKEKLAEQQNKELDNNEEIKKLAKELKDTFKEATKNKSIDSKTLKDMADAAASMQEMADKDMPEIAGDLDQAQDKKNSEEKTKEDLEKAIEKQEELVDKMKETAEKAEKAKEKLESSTFVNRLKQAASDEESIAQTIISDANEIIGLHYGELDPVFKRLVQALFLQQEQATSDVRWIQEDLAFFHARTQKPEHKKILDKMKDAKITEALSAIEREIELQRTGNAMRETMESAQKLREWAKELDGTQDQSGGGGGGGGGGGASDEDQDFEFMLKVMKMIQEEQRLRSKTRALEQSKRDVTDPDATHAPSLEVETQPVP
ncbi:MAG: hypothetical protein ACSHX6_09645 [Akkermansiaceae bacterium]